jgi:hypothetical protein
MYGTMRKIAKVTYYSKSACRKYTAKKYFGDLPNGAV